MENLNEVIPKQETLQTINAAKCRHDGARRVEVMFGDKKIYCMMCGDRISE